MTIGLIIAAGKQTRFKSDIPKALVPYKDKPLVEVNIERLSRYCDDVYVVCSNENYPLFSAYKRIKISSGLGCGDAVFKALTQLFNSSMLGDFSTFIQWGDCIVDPLVYTSCVKEANNASTALMIPCKKETHPYVAVEYDHTNQVKVKFSKYDKMPTQGYHDLSAFYISSAYSLLQALISFRSQFMLNGAYNYPNRNNEFQFLDVLNAGLINGRIIDLTSEHTQCFSFNTLEEYNNAKELF